MNHIARACARGTLAFAASGGFPQPGPVPGVSTAGGGGGSALPSVDALSVMTMPSYRARVRGRDRRLGCVAPANLKRLNIRSRDRAYPLSKNSPATLSINGFR